MTTLAPANDLDFLHILTVRSAEPMTALGAWNRITAEPPPGLGLAFRLRDALSAPFGVKRIGGFSGRAREQVQAGDRLDFFLVEQATNTALVLTARDRHLDAMTSVAVSGRDVTVTTSVKIHTLFGRAYMIPVGLAHPMIVRVTMARLKHPNS